MTALAPNPAARLKNSLMALSFAIVGGGMAAALWMAAPDLPPPSVLVFLVFLAWFVTAFFCAGYDEISDMLRARRDCARAP